MAIILGIDPGSRKTGFGLIEQQGSSLRYLTCGTIHVVSKGEVPARLGEIFARLTDVCQEWKPNEVSIEKVFMAHNPDSALKLGQARGAAITAAVSQQIPVFEYSARQVKQAVTGQGAALKHQVGHMVCRLLELDEAPQEDAADALAIAICHAHLRTSIQRLALSSGYARHRLKVTAATPKKSNKQFTIGYPR